MNPEIESLGIPHDLPDSISHGPPPPGVLPLLPIFCNFQWRGELAFEELFSRIKHII